MVYYFGCFFFGSFGREGGNDGVSYTGGWLYFNVPGVGGCDHDKPEGRLDGTTGRVREVVCSVEHY